MSKPIEILTTDGGKYVVDSKVLLTSKTFKDMMDNDGDSITLPPNITKNVIDKILEYVLYHHENPTEEVENGKKFSKWDNDFVKDIKGPLLFDILMGADYLMYKNLMDLTAHKVANSLRGKKMDEIREEYQIPNTWTEEEKAAAKRAEEWLEKGLE